MSLRDAYAAYPCVPSRDINASVHIPHKSFPDESWIAPPLVAPLPEQFYDCFRARRMAHVNPEQLRFDQQTALRGLDLYKNGDHRWQASQDLRKLREMEVLRSSTVDCDEGPFGLAHVTTAEAELLKRRDGGYCSVCATPSELEAAHIIDKTRKTNDDVRTFRRTRIDRYFRKDLPGNLVTLCQEHHTQMDKWKWTFLPSEPDLRAMLEYELEDRYRRAVAWNDLMATDPDALPPPRTVPPPWMYSGWFEILPLSPNLKNRTFGPYEFKLSTQLLRAASQGEMACLQAEGQKIDYVADGGVGPIPKYFFNHKTKELLVFLGLSDLNLQATLWRARKAIGCFTGLLPPRLTVLNELIHVLVQLYHSPLFLPPSKNSTIPPGIGLPATWGLLGNAESGEVGHSIQSLIYEDATLEDDATDPEVQSRADMQRRLEFGRIESKTEAQDNQVTSTPPGLYVAPDQTHHPTSAQKQSPHASGATGAYKFGSPDNTAVNTSTPGIVTSLSLSRAAYDAVQTSPIMVNAQRLTSSSTGSYRTWVTYASDEAAKAQTSRKIVEGLGGVTNPHGKAFKELKRKVRELVAELPEMDVAPAKYRATIVEHTKPHSARPVLPSTKMRHISEPSVRASQTRDNASRHAPPARTSASTSSMPHARPTSKTGTGSARPPALTVPQLAAVRVTIASATATNTSKPTTQEPQRRQTVAVQPASRPASSPSVRLTADNTYSSITVGTVRIPHRLDFEGSRCRDVQTIIAFVASRGSCIRGELWNYLVQQGWDTDPRNRTEVLKFWLMVVAKCTHTKNEDDQLVTLDAVKLSKAGLS